MKFSPEYLRSRFSYDPETGDLTFKPKSPDTCYDRMWNTKHSGKKAGSITTTRNGKKYLIVGVDGQTLYAHRVIWIITNGFSPDQIDHEDGDGLRNEWVNLRDASHTENAHNQRRRTSNSSGITGVRYRPGFKWIAFICCDRKQVHIGSYETLLDAACARKSAELRYGFHENHGTDRPL
jgi:hypothetical protein